MSETERPTEEKVEEKTDKKADPVAELIKKISDGAIAPLIEKVDKLDGADNEKVAALQKTTSYTGRKLEEVTRLQEKILKQQQEAVEAAAKIAEKKVADAKAAEEKAAADKAAEELAEEKAAEEAKKETPSGEDPKFKALEDQIKEAEKTTDRVAELEKKLEQSEINAHRERLKNELADDPAIQDILDAGANVKELDALAERLRPLSEKVTALQAKTAEVDKETKRVEEATKPKLPKMVTRDAEDKLPEGVDGSKFVGRQDIIDQIYDDKKKGNLSKRKPRGYG